MQNLELSNRSFSLSLNDLKRLLLQMNTSRVEICTLTWTTTVDLS